jgi:hypothetical protein
MSVQSEIERIQKNVASTYSVLEQAGADIPQSRNTNNLSETAASIKAVLYGKAQSLTEAQKFQARQNIGIASTEEIVQEVITALGTPVFGRVDAENNIILTGELADGTYTLKYEGADGSQTEIGEIVVGAVQITNQIPISTDKNGNIYGEDYNGDGVNDGYKVNTRVSGGNDQTYSGVTTTGYIPVQVGDIVYFKNITMSKTGHKYACRIAMFESLTSTDQMSADHESASDLFTWDDNGNATSFRVSNWFIDKGTTVQFIRVGAAYIGSDSIISINKPIE